VQEIVQPRQALYYIMTGDPFDGRRAADIGLVTMAVPRVALAPRVQEIADKLKQKDPIALRACKEAFKAVAPTVGYEDAWYWLAAKSDQLTYLQKTRGQQDGIEGFLRKEFKPGLGSPDAPPSGG